MARTLTEQEQQTLQRLRDRLLNVLSSEERCYAAGIASSLVRIREPEITDADLTRILNKYDAPKKNLLEAIKTQLLKPVSGKKGTYTLRKKNAKALPAATKAKNDEGPGVETGRKPRRRSTKSTAQTESTAASPAESETNKAPAEDDANTPSANASDLRPGRSERGHAHTASADNEEAPQGKPEEDETAAAVVDGSPQTDEPSNDGSSTDPSDHSVEQSGEDTPVTPDASDAADVSGALEAAEVGNATDAVAGAAGASDVTDAVAGADATDTAADAEASAGQPDEHAPEADGKDDIPSAQSPSAQDKDSNNHARNGKKRKNERDPRRIPYVRRGDEDDAALRQKIVQLDPRFWMNGWLLSHPGAYTMFEHELNAMSEALAEGDVLPGDITRRQLAYQLGGDEKFFEYGADGFRLLRAMGLESIIRHRPLPKIDLVYHAPRRRKRMRVLVTENLDPYLDVHDLMYEEGQSMFLGERIHAVVLGGGTPILEHNRLSLLLDTFRADRIDVLYWGDIDRAGLQIMCKLKDVLGDQYGFEPFTPAYQLMVQKAMERFPEPADNELTGQDNIDLYDIDFLCQGLSESEAAYARAVIEHCCLIPQEILTKRDL